jgi:outer membrane lipopolysaccharide assembly protein LptE/RlpB
MIIPRFFPVLAAFALAGCAGYVQGPVKPTPMAKVKTIAVPSFKNDTLETRVEVQLANSVIKQIQQDGTYQIADEKNADAILEGTLTTIQRRPERSVQGNTLLSREYSLILTVNFRVTNRVTGVEIERRTVKGQTTFFVSGSNALAADVLQDERQALPLAAEDLAIRLVSQISEGW